MAGKKDKYMIFSITAGRTGTGYLCRLMSLVPGVLSLHEPAPDFVTVMRQVQTDPDIAKKFLLEKKLPFIRKQNCDVYVETSHLFCKGFLEPLYILGVEFGCIILRRNPRYIALSLYQLNTIPGRTDLGLRYYLYPDDPVFLKLPDWHRYNDYQLCYWYALEMDYRCSYYKSFLNARNIKTFETSIDQLKSFDHFIELCSTFSLPLPDKNEFYSVSSQVVNSKKELKRPVPDELLKNIDSYEHEIEINIKRPE